MIKGALEADGRLAAKNAVKIRAALYQVTDFKRVFNKYQETQPQPTDNPAQDRTRARSWLILNIYLNDEPLRQAVTRAWAEAYLLGQAAAGEWIRKTREANKADDIEINWDNWKPGDKATALLLNPPKGFLDYLTSVNADSYFKKFNKETVINLGTALSDSIAAGLDAESAAVMIGRHVASPSRALTIAITEQNRAMSFGSIQNYKEAGLQKMEWAVSDPCDVCAKNDGQVIVIGQTFASGDAQPPAHPHCRCVLLPVIPGYEETPDMPGVTIVEPPAPAPAFLTPKEEIAQIVTALQEGGSRNEALDAYLALDERKFKPGEWQILPRDVVKEAAIANLMRAYVTPMSRGTIEKAFYASNTIKKVDRDFLEKAIIYKNGPIEVQFSSTGLTLTEAERKMVVDKVAQLQITNPKTRAIVHIAKNDATKYGWAYGGKSDLWVTPKTLKTERDLSTYKMPVNPAITQFEYTLAHEWGHLIDDITDSIQSPKHKNAIARLKAEYPDAFKSKYSGENTKEFFAEMFTEYYNTGGQTSNLLAQAMAREFGWKVPEVIGPKIGYVAAKYKADVYLADIEAAEQKLQGFIPTVKRADGTVVPDWKFASGGSAPENIQLRNLMKEQGFLGKPRIVDPVEFKKMVDQGATPIYRGLGAETQENVNEYVARLLTGDEPYIGRGFFGDGTYFASDRGIAERFAAQDVTGEINFKFGEVLEGVLDPQAKVIDIEDLWKLRNQYVESMPYHGSLAQAYEDDIGLFATTQGYDAIINKNPMIGYTPEGQRRYAPGAYYTILNRTALIMKGTP